MYKKPTAAFKPAQRERMDSFVKKISLRFVNIIITTAGHRLPLAFAS